MLQPGRSVSRCLFSRCALAALQGIKVCQPVCVDVVVASTHRIGKFRAGLHRHDVVQRLDGGIHPADLRQLRLAALRKLLRSGSLLSCLGALLRLLGPAEDLLDLRRLHQGLLQPLRCQPSGLEVVCQLGVGRGRLECSPVLHVFYGLARKRILDPGLAKDLFFPLCPLRRQGGVDRLPLLPLSAGRGLLAAGLLVLRLLRLLRRSVLRFRLRLCRVIFRFFGLCRGGDLLPVFACRSLVSVRGGGSLLVCAFFGLRQPKLLIPIHRVPSCPSGRHLLLPALPLSFLPAVMRRSVPVWIRL